MVINTGCAVIVPPEGGERDTIPPQLVKASPGDSTKRFKGKKIVLTFDEYVKLNNWRENLLISPTPTIEPKIEAKLRNVTILINDSLEANTTYTYDFTKAIQDENEGNMVKNFKYIFTTGDHFDSLSFSGRVLLAENGKIDTTLLVLLHTNGEDSAVRNEKPKYVARLDSKGYFTFTNLPAGTFYLYALKDNGGKRYLSTTQLFAFADKPVVTTEKNDSIILYAYANKQTISLPNITPGIRRPGNAGNKPEDRRLKFQHNAGTSMDLLGDLRIQFESPLKNFDSSMMHLSTDSTFAPVSNYQLTLDSTRQKLVLKTTWKENTKYNLILEKDFAEDSLGKKLLKKDTISFTTKRNSDYGQLRIRFKNLDLSKNPVLQFVQNDQVMRSTPLTSNEVNFSLFLPGDYELRILYDKNKNGVWDIGKFYKEHLQPELIVPVERKINVKPNWENEFEIAI